jgi:transcriptional regulator with XRE-family HTH domain
MAQGSWQARVTCVVAAQLRHYRDIRGLSAQDLTDRCAELGFTFPRPVLSNLENGRREAVSVAELIILARALDVSPLQLVTPAGRQDAIELFPGDERPVWDAARWFTGEIDLEELNGQLPGIPLPGWQGNVDPVEPLPAFRRHDALVAAWRAQRDVVLPSPQGEPDPELAREMLAIAATQTQRLESDLGWLRRELRRQQLIPPPLPAELAHVDKQASRRGAAERRKYKRRTVL